MKLSPLFSIRNRNLKIRAPRIEDAELVFSASRYPGFTDGMLWEPPDRISESQKSIQRAMTAWSEGRAYNFTIDQITSDRFISVGRISLRQTDIAKRLDIGFWTHPSFQGQGIMTQAVQMITGFAFNFFNAVSVQACYAKWNKASEMVLYKNGFQYEDTIAQGFKKNGKWVEEIKAVLFNSEQPITDRSKNKNAPD